MPKYTKKSKKLSIKNSIRNNMFGFSDRRAHNATTKPTTKTGVDEEMPVDDGMSVCSNISDATSIYDEVEGKEIKKKII